MGSIGKQGGMAEGGAGMGKGAMYGMGKPMYGGGMGGKGGEMCGGGKPLMHGGNEDPRAARNVEGGPPRAMMAGARGVTIKEGSLR